MTDTGKPVIAVLDATVQAAVDVMLAAQASAKAAEAAIKAAKATILAALGDCKVGVLPDDRVVTAVSTVVEPATIERKGYTSVSLKVS